MMAMGCPFLIGNIALVDVGMTFLDGDPVGGDATACEFPAGHSGLHWLC